MLLPVIVSQYDLSQVLASRLRMPVLVDPIPLEFTPENLARWAKFCLMPMFLPDVEITEDMDIPGWTKPKKWFYDQIRGGKISADSAKLSHGWYLADITHGADYTYGTQVFPSDWLSPIIARLREQGKIGKYNNIPMGSRFAITNDEWRNVVCPAIAEALGFRPEQVRLERAIEFNAIGNLYDPNRGKYNMWEWFEDIFGGFQPALRWMSRGRRLFGVGNFSTKGGVLHIDGEIGYHTGATTGSR